MQRSTVVMILLVAGLVGWCAVVRQRRQLDQARANACFINVKEVGTAIIAYSMDHDGRLPIASAYPGAIVGYPLPISYSAFGILSLSRQSLVCPADPRQARPGYAYCRAWAGANLDTIFNRGESVMLYDAIGDQPAYRHPHWTGVDHRPTLTVGYCDGRVEQDNAAEFRIENARTGRGPDYYPLNYLPIPSPKPGTGAP
jgi:hypothetical protein